MAIRPSIMKAWYNYRPHIIVGGAAATGAGLGAAGAGEGHRAKGALTGAALGTLSGVGGHALGQIGAEELARKALRKINRRVDDINDIIRQRGTPPYGTPKWESLTKLENEATDLIIKKHRILDRVRDISGVAGAAAGAVPAGLVAGKAFSKEKTGAVMHDIEELAFEKLAMIRAEEMLKEALSANSLRQLKKIEALGDKASDKGWRYAVSRIGAKDAGTIAGRGGTIRSLASGQRRRNISRSLTGQPKREYPDIPGIDRSKVIWPR